MACVERLDSVRANRRRETYDEECETSVQLERSVRLLILGVEHIVLRRPSSVSERCTQGGLSLARHTMIRRFPKLGCGVGEGLGTGTVHVDAAAIYSEERGKTGESGGKGPGVGSSE